MENRIRTRVAGHSHFVAEPFGRPREFFNNRYVYAVISSRAKGLSVGININPTMHCTFDCVYCEVNHNDPVTETHCNLNVMADELQKTVNFVRSGEIRSDPFFGKLPQELIELRHIAISGNGEPTLCRDFLGAVQTVMHVRAKSRDFFKVVLITNGTGLHLPEVQEGLRYFTVHDEVWIKLDAGSPMYAQRINRTTVPFERTLENILQIAKKRSVTIQSLFPYIDGEEPGEDEIRQYADCLADLRRSGAKINLVQIYSADRPSHKSGCSHLPLKTLSAIAKTVRESTGLRAEVF